MTSLPPLTIGVPVYNGARFLERQLASLCTQEYADFRVVISDNGSTDATAEIARSFADRDERFAYHRQPVNIGGARNCQYLLDTAGSPWFKWAFYDDVCAPDLLRRSMEILAGAPRQTVGAFPRVRLIDADDRVVGAHDDADLDLTSPDPCDRLHVLLTRVAAQVQFGILATRTAQELGGISRQPGGEMVFPTGLVLQGPLELVHDGFVSIRDHAGRHGGRRLSELAWLDPSRRRVAFPYSRSSALLLDTVRSAPLSARDRRRCAATVLRDWTGPGWRTIVGDVLRLPSDLGLRRPPLRSALP